MLTIYDTLQIHPDHKIQVQFGDPISLSNTLIRVEVKSVSITDYVFINLKKSPFT